MAVGAVQNPKTIYIEETPDNQSILSKITQTYQSIPGGLIPVLQQAQDTFGYLPQWSIEQISREMGQSLSLVAGVVSFYSYFSTQPKGKHTARVCLGTACYVRGGNQVMRAVSEYLGIDCGETTEDGLFSLDSGRCFGACGLAPVMMVGEDVIQRVKTTHIKELLDSYLEETSSSKGNPEQIQNQDRNQKFDEVGNTSFDQQVSEGGIS